MGNPWPNLRHGRRDNALTAIPKIADAKLQAAFYRQLGMDQQAEQALASAENTGPRGCSKGGRRYRILEYIWHCYSV